MAKPKSSSLEQVPESILFELLTESEIRMVRNRWRVVMLLTQGMSIRRVADLVKVGTDTVVRMSKLLRHNKKIKDFIENEDPQYLKNSEASKWVFGTVGGEK